MIVEERGDFFNLSVTGLFLPSQVVFSLALGNVFHVRKTAEHFPEHKTFLKFMMTN
jgi:hypothetical protein